MNIEINFFQFRIFSILNSLKTDTV